jgi:triacylglycerol esterase/lipase EstA (alpha/beta hydrolase family)
MRHPTPLAATLPAVARALLEGDAPPLLDGPDRRDAPPIVLLHGFGTSSRVLAPLARRLCRELRRPVVRCALGGALPLHLGDVRRTARRVHAEIEQLAARSAFDHVDVVGHSLGGLVAAYLLKCLDRGRRIRRVVTLGTPHRGTPLAILGVLLLGLVSRAVWQMLPGAPLLEELATTPVPERSELIAIGSDADGVVPRAFASVLPAPRQVNALVTELGHVDFLVSRKAFRFVAAALA